MLCLSYYSPQTFLFAGSRVVHSSLKISCKTEIFSVDVLGVYIVYAKNIFHSKIHSYSVHCVSNTLHFSSTPHSVPRGINPISQNNLQLAQEFENGFRESLLLLFLNPVASVWDCYEPSEICATLVISLNGTRIQ